MTTSRRHPSGGALIVVIVGATLLLTPIGERPLAALFAGGDVEGVDFSTMTPPNDPNRFPGCPPGLCAAAAGADGPVFEISAERPRAGWREVVVARFVSVSPARSMLAIYSRSVFGRNDFGVNRARIEAWLAILSEGP